MLLAIIWVNLEDSVVKWNREKKYKCSEAWWHKPANLATRGLGRKWQIQTLLELQNKFKAKFSKLVKPCLQTNSKLSVEAIAH